MKHVFVLGLTLTPKISYLLKDLYKETTIRDLRKADVIGPRYGVHCGADALHRVRSKASRGNTRDCEGIRVLIIPDPVAGIRV